LVRVDSVSFSEIANVVPAAAVEVTLRGAAGAGVRSDVLGVGDGRVPGRRVVCRGDGWGGV
jgi:hypothetical protein